jgi:23S rRNA (adenine2503-C2)-methyltransferase
MRCMSADLDCTSSPPASVLDLSAEDVATLIASHGQPAFRAKQVLEWVYRHGAESFDAMTNLPKGLRDALSRQTRVFQATVVRQQASSDGTIKQLLAWPDGATSECVMIPQHRSEERDAGAALRRTACISSQVGCPVGCVFCASGLDGLSRQLTAGQIVEQAMRVARLCAEQGERLTNVVFMGLGEPLANYAATLRAIRTINADWGMNIGARKITVSTVGLPSQMRRLADEGVQVTLALSLHAPTDELRRTIIPWADRVGIDELIDAGRYYFDRTGREVTIEYILLGGLNDAETHARRLATVARRVRSNVNLIRYNPVPGLPYLRPTAEAAHAFLHTLKGAGINVHLRKSRGLDIDAACGQLRRREAKETTVKLDVSESS